MKARKLTVTAMAAAMAAGACAQIPDLLTALDAGGRAMGLGGGTYVSGFDTTVSLFNPAALAFTSRSQIGMVLRNLPESSTEVTRDFVNGDLNTRGQRGGFSVTHAGFVFPLNRTRGGGAGSVGLAFTTDGYVRDERFGDGIPSGDLIVRGYQEVIKSRTDYISLAYGRSLSASGNVNVGLGVLYAINTIFNSQRYNLLDVDENLRGRVVLDNSSTGTGLGFVAGIQFVPSGNLSFGVSYRSEIDLSNNAKTSAFYDKIPARLSGGFAWRRDGLRNGRDFIVIGGQVDHFFAGQKGAILDRDAQTTVGGGVEYNYFMQGARIPIRVGYRAVPAGGDFFKSRNALTFGIGYHSDANLAGIDLNFASPDGGGFDVALGITYRIGK